MLLKLLQEQSNLHGAIVDYVIDWFDRSEQRDFTLPSLYEVSFSIAKTFGAKLSEQQRQQLAEYIRHWISGEAKEPAPFEDEIDDWVTGTLRI